MLLSLAALLAAEDNTAANAVKNVTDIVSRTKPDEKAFSDLAQLAGSQPLATPTLTFAFPIALVVTGFFLHVAIEMWSDKGLNFRPHLIRLVVFTLLVNAYVPVSRGIAGFVLSIGAVNEAGVAKESSKTKTFLAAQRTKYFEDKKKMEDEIAALDKRAAQLGRPPQEDSSGFLDKASDAINGKLDSIAASMFFSVIQMTVELSFLFASVAIFFLKMLQTAMMNVILGVGPLMIAFSSWPGVTSRYLSAWVSALIETAAWGIFSGTLIRLLASNAESRSASTESGGMFEFVGLNILYAASLISVPAITSSVLRGSAAGGSMMSGMLGATMATASRVGAAAKAGAGAAAQAAGDALKRKPNDSNDSVGTDAKTESGRDSRSADTAFDPRREFFRNQAANEKKKDGQ